MKEVKYTLKKKEIFLFYLRANMTILLFFGVAFLAACIASLMCWFFSPVFIEVLIIAGAILSVFLGLFAKMLLAYRNSIKNDEQLNSEITLFYSADAVSASACGQRGDTAKWSSLVEVIRFFSVLILRFDEKNSVIVPADGIPPEDKGAICGLVREKVKKHNLYGAQ
jgi:membrane-associated HD superfamily phosphohydrolase